MMTWLKELLVRRQNHHSIEMDRHSESTGGSSLVASIAAVGKSHGLSIFDDTKRRRAGGQEPRVSIESTSDDKVAQNNKTTSSSSFANSRMGDFTSSAEKENSQTIAKSTRTAQKVRPSSASSWTLSPSSSKISKSGGSKSRDRRQRAPSSAISVSMQSIALLQRATAPTTTIVGQKVTTMEESILNGRLDETKELRLPKLVQEQHEATPTTTEIGQAWCHYTKNDDDVESNNKTHNNNNNIKSRPDDGGHQRLVRAATLREKQILTNCQSSAMMKVAPRATSFYCDKTPALTSAPLAVGRPLDKSCKTTTTTSQVVVAAAATVGDGERSPAASEFEPGCNGAAFVVTSSQRQQLKQEQKQKQNENNKSKASSSVLFKAKLRRNTRPATLTARHHTRSNTLGSLAFSVASGRRHESKRSPMLIAEASFLLVVLAVLSGFGRESGSGVVVVSGAELKQTITVQPDPIYFVPVGSQVKLPCHVSNRQGECAWARSGKIVPPGGKKYNFIRDPQNGECSITIKNVTVLADDGEWQCQALSPADGDAEAALSRSAKLVVLVPPERPQIRDLSRQASRLILEEKKERNITCEVRGGNPPPQIEWYLDGKPMNQHAELVQRTQEEEKQKLPANQFVQSRLLLNSIKRSMNGKNLTCVGVHQTLNQSTSIELDVQYVPSASLAQKEYTLVEGSPLTVPCVVDANPPASHISWRFINADSPSGTKGEAIVTMKTGPILEVNQVSRAYNRVMYECLAQNTLGVGPPAEMRLNVLYPPRSFNTTESGPVLVGQSKQLQCLFDGNPQPEIKWFYQDPLSRSAASVLIDNSKDWDKRPKNLYDQQYLAIQNVTYRNEGEYYCEARNTINGQSNMVRSTPITLDVFGMPQFLAKSPVYAKAIQGSKSDISLTFCADPPPTSAYWHFGSIRVDVKLSPTGSDSRAPSSGQLGGRHQPTLNTKYQAQPLAPLQRRDTSFSRPATCFESTLSLMEPEMSDQRDYYLVVTNEQGLPSQGFVRVRVSSPLSPALMITSAFVFICVLFLCSLLFLFIFKKRHQFMSGARRANNGSVHSSQANGSSNGTAGSNERRKRTSRKDKNLLAGQTNGADLVNNGVHASKATSASQHSNGYQQQQLNNNTNGHQQQQTKGVVNGAANGHANGASNPASATSMLNGASPLEEQHNQASGKGLVHGLMSMASSDTSCNDQKQLLASNCSDRNSSVGGGSSNGVAIDVNTPSDHYGHHNISNTMTSNSGSNTDRSTANSSPSPMNHISVDDELNLNGTYQATEPITRGAKLSPPLGAGLQAQINHPHHLNGQGALIYANLDYTNSTRQAANEKGGRGDDDNDDDIDDDDDDDNDSYNGHLASHRVDLRRNQLQHSPEASTMTLGKHSATNSAGVRRRQETPQLSPSGSNATVQENHFLNQQHQEPSATRTNGHDTNGSPSSIRPSVGATIALMNSLAAAQSAAAAGSINSPPGNPNDMSQPTGVLNGAISQQLMANQANRVRKPGPPKPPKPSIQQRSRFYQQQQQQASNNTGLVMIGDSQLGAYPMATGTHHLTKLEPEEERASGAPNDLAVEYSRLAFPARAEL